LTQHPHDITGVVEAAHAVARLLLLVSTTNFRTELTKVAHSVVAEYVTGTHKGALHTKVKRELCRGLYKLMGVSDKYRLAALNASLTPGVKDTFRLLHQEYKKYHQYRGMV
ncbi:unhealthy ribosome biogenesis protein 2 homolog, partial [Aplysia californica]|uniref:Unhealthy ribosome biogenesis protein 2 homolog n=1 Tax=Aplysia californica TaxID=6500 RepID=A0ABM1A1K3_APLCA